MPLENGELNPTSGIGTGGYILEEYEPRGAQYLEAQPKLLQGGQLSLRVG